MFVGVDGVLGLDGDVVGTTRSGWMDWNDGLQLRKRSIVTRRVCGVLGGHLDFLRGGSVLVMRRSRGGINEITESLRKSACFLYGGYGYY